VRYLKTAILPPARIVPKEKKFVNNALASLVVDVPIYEYPDAFVTNVEPKFKTRGMREV
jgi:hypothetical protein